MIALYVRVSSAEQFEHGYSVGEQTARLKAYCVAKGWKNYKVYTDGGFSGATTDRPALADLVKAVLNGEIEKVIVYKLDRLSRSQKDTLTLIEDIFLSHGVDFVSITENFDTSTPLGRAMIGILSVFAQLEREQIKERMQIGIEARAKEGMFHGNGTPPIGYDYKNGKLVINEFERIQVVKAFEMFLNGTPIKRIARTLNESGLTHKYGEWTPNRIRLVLQNETYTGIIKKGTSAYSGIHEPIISTETFENAALFLKQRTERFKEHNTRSGIVASYLGGLLVCSHCGGKYSRITKARGTKKDRYYCCNSRAGTNPATVKDRSCKNKIWKEDELNGIVFSEIKQLVLLPDNEPSASVHVENPVENLKRESARIDEQISRLLDLYSNDSIPLSSVQEKIKSLSEKKAALEATIKKENRPKGMTVSDAQETASTLEFAIENGTFEEVRLIVESLIEYIELDNEAITIHWNF